MEAHPSNIAFMLLTLEVIKFSKFNCVKEAQSLNIPSIFLVLLVLK